MARCREQTAPRVRGMAARCPRRDLVEEVQPGRILGLLARGRPLGEARVRIELAPSGAGTTLTMHEAPVAGPGKWLHNPLTEALLARRNSESLTRLTALVERHTQPSDA
jgi:hypothetical protein